MKREETFMDKVNGVLTLVGALLLFVGGYALISGEEFCLSDCRSMPRSEGVLIMGFGLLTWAINGGLLYLTNRPKKAEPYYPYSDIAAHRAMVARRLDRAERCRRVPLTKQDYKDMETILGRGPTHFNPLGNSADTLRRIIERHQS